MLFSNVESVWINVHHCHLATDSVQHDRKCSRRAADQQNLFSFRLFENTEHHMNIGAGADSFRRGLAMETGILIIGTGTIVLRFDNLDVTKFRV